MSILLENSEGEILVINGPYFDMEKLSGKSYCNIEVISGQRSGESAQIEELKIYNAIIDLLSKEI
jgi:hypothetical protein